MRLTKMIVAAITAACMIASVPVYGSVAGPLYGGGTAGDGQRLKTVATEGNYVFKGWALNGDKSKLYQAGDQVVVDQELAKGSTELKFEAVYEEIDVKYAVAIYGINQDIDQNGEPISLTFGPATGKSYVDTYSACPGTSEGNPTYNDHKCLHWMSWSEIIEQANKDPSVFLDCLKNGCTHSVELLFGDSPLKGNSTYPDMSGDGASVLCESLNMRYRAWNDMVYDNTGGWPASRIRTTLNGKQTCAETDPSLAGRDLLTESQALISAFPEELRNAIVPKAVKSDTVYNSEDAENVKTTYDRLWLFSGRELRTGSTGNDVRKNESNVSTGYYQRASELGISSSNYGKLMGYAESWDTELWWLRSVARNDSRSVYSVDPSGKWGYEKTGDSAFSGVAPGFCLGKVQ